MIDKVPSTIQTIAIDKPKNQAIFVDQTASKTIAVTVPSQPATKNTDTPRKEISVNSKEDEDVAVVTSVLRGEKGDPGVGLQYEWMGSKLGIKTEIEENFQYVDLVAASGDISYVHDQIAASKEWRIIHNLDKHPSVTIVDSAGSVVVGDIFYVSQQELIVSFVSEFAGRAFLN